MPRAFALAIGLLADRRIHGVLGACVLLSLAVFAGLWWSLDLALAALPVEGDGWRTALDWIGALATVVAAWFLLPIVMSACVALFLDRVARIVEARHYPDLPPAPGLPWHRALLATAQFVGLLLLVNVLLLALWWFPGVYALAFPLANGLLLGREYFDLVAQRRLDLAAARALRRRHGSGIWLLGLAIGACSTLPIVNLVAPVLGTAAMVHCFEGWRRERLQAAGG
ncbi:MAG: EI24 domain-containing protein [Planctomycetes bacterium]|nr:EI24 domain-containing protein [Planctomycetota bacterium]